MEREQKGSEICLSTFLFYMPKIGITLFLKDNNNDNNSQATNGNKVHFTCEACKAAQDALTRGCVAPTTMRRINRPRATATTTTTTRI